MDKQTEPCDALVRVDGCNAFERVAEFVLLIQKEILERVEVDARRARGSEARATGDASGVEDTR